jgi:hypothetical protein
VWYYYTENSHVVSDETSEEATKNDTSFGPENCFVIIGCMGSYTVLLEEPVFLLLVA